MENLREESPFEGSTFESLFQKGIVCAKKWGRGALGAVVLLAAAAPEIRSLKREHEWRRYTEDALSPHEKAETKALARKIAEIFGDEVNARIEQGDETAYFLRKEKREKARIVGFEESGLSNVARYMLTEDFMFFPKGWIDGEVDKIVYVDREEDLHELQSDGVLLGEVEDQIISSRPAMYIYQNPRYKDYIAKYPYLAVDDNTVFHELGHVNDWLHNEDLTIVERQRLLLETYGRMMSKDCYHDPAGKYYEDFIETVLYRAVSEYWAEICAAYFSDPHSFNAEHPHDFALVDAWVKKKDPSFDIFNKDRGAFDSQTGKLKEVWQKKFGRDPEGVLLKAE